MSYNRFLELLLRKKSGQLSSEEVRELNELFGANRGFQQLSGIVEEVYNVPLNEVSEVDKAYLERRWTSLAKKTVYKEEDQPPVESSTISVRWKYYLAAASVLVALVLGTVYIMTVRNFTAKDVIVETKMGSKSSIKLPDGSTVWLNAGSEISYGDDFGKSTRDVQLIGEAYFDVTHDVNHPFIVHTRDFDVKVMGTEFNVKSYNEDPETQATLVSGSIELTINDDKGRTFLLKPNEKVVVRNVENTKEKALNNTPPLPMQEVEITGLEEPFSDSLAVETQWMNNCLAFRDARLKEVAQLITRWYGVSVEITDKALAEKKFSGSFKDETVQEVMHALKLAGRFKYSIDKNKITIVP